MPLLDAVKSRLCDDTATTDPSAVHAVEAAVRAETARLRADLQIAEDDERIAWTGWVFTYEDDGVRLGTLHPGSGLRLLDPGQCVVSVPPAEPGSADLTAETYRQIGEGAMLEDAETAGATLAHNVALLARIYRANAAAYACISPCFFLAMHDNTGIRYVSDLIANELPALTAV